MQSRRHDDYRARPSSMASRLRDPRIQEDAPPDHYRREVVERSPPPRRSLSPHRRVGGGGERRSGGSFEGRDFYRSDPRGESNHLRSQSTRFGRLDERRPENYPPRESRDEFRRKYDAAGEVLDYGNDLGSGFNRGSYGSLRGNFNDDPRYGVPEREVYGDRRMVSQNGGGMHRGEYRLHPAAELDSNVRDVKDNGERYPLSPRNPDHASFNHGQDRYPDHNLLRKLVAIEKEERYSNADNFPPMERMERYGKHEESVPKPRDVSYFKGSASASKEYSGMPQSREYGAAPLRGSGMNIPSSYHGDVQHLPAETHPSRGSQHEERYLENRSSEKRHMDRRDLAANHEDLLTYQRPEYKSRIHEGYQVGYMYPPHESQKNGNRSQPSEELSNNLHHPKQGGYYRGDNISADVVNPTRQHEAYADYSQRLHMHNSRGFRDQPTRIRSTSDYLSDDRSVTAREQGGMYLDSRNSRNEGGRYLDRRDAVNEFDETVLVDPEVGGMYLDPRDVVNEFNGKALVEPKVPLPDIPARDVFSRRRIVHVPERDDALLVPGRESLRTPVDTQYEMELQEHHLRRKGIGSDDRYEYDLSQRLPKRTKYPLDEEPSYPTKRPLSSRLGNFNGEGQHDREGRWISGKARDYLPPKSMKSGHNIYSRIGRHVGDSTSQDWDLSEDQDEYLPEYSSRSYEPGKRMLNGPPRHGLPKPYNQRNSLGSNVWVRDKDNKLHDESIDEQWESKEMMDLEESGPHEDLEDCEEFKQMVQEHFLSFSKILNEKISTRNRYKEQGRAGSLYCIVCGKSISKEFLDTRSLVTHCYMSKKVGLRESHLGLLKAICVLLGWNTVVDRDVVTFSPQVISNSEALAQKEDLIIWPPAIVIHGIPISASYTGRQNVLTKEGVEEFLRGRGISVGKTKVVPGMSANNDIIVVKFLGTFSGLQDAKNLHGYFMDEKHGRLDYEQIAFGNNTKLERVPGPKLEESLIYGFMAISEDLDIVDFDTKRKCTIKSKREIEDIADAPVTQ